MEKWGHDLYPNTAIWTPAVTIPDHFEVYAQWPQHATHPSNAPFTVHHAGGSTTVYADQQVNGGQWNLLGTFVLQPGQNHRVEVTDEGNGTVVADAIKFTPVTASPNAAIWTPTISTSDSYRIYTRWTSHPNRATDATYTVHHQGGSSQVVVNQQQNGGEWVLLGTYTMDPSSNHRIELSDEANGVVVADAVYIVSASVAQDSVTWEPTLASSELVDVFATWVEGADRSSQVSYTVHHAGGSTTSNVNQRVNGGVWNYLGRFTMNPSSNHRVEVTDSTGGIVVADAVRFVNVTTSGTGLMYVHSDHLGTPQKMTNESQALVWDAVYEPFGEVHSLTGTASNNQRFPGQYLDAESNFHYNYFRDYDPSTGRYVQSDPLGIVAGLNVFSYVSNDPMNWIDPYGLFKCGRGVNCDFTETLRNALLCMEKECNREFTITDGRRSNEQGTNHAKGQAADIGENNPDNQGICRTEFENCFKKCFPKGAYGQQEWNSADIGGTHYHLQTNEGSGKSGPPRMPHDIQPHTQGGK